MLCPSCGADAGEVSKFCPSCGASIVRAVDEDDYIGQIVAKKYRVEQLIGEGGMGKVYRAKQLALDKPVVLKVLRQSLLSDERTVARFQREAKAASRLNHPNSISVLDFGQTEDGALYIAMEFVPGKDLHQILSKEWPLPEARLVRIVGQVLSALADAHGAGVIHRDLKPENIMVEQRRGEPDFVKVLDFGIAKIQDSAGDEGPALTRAGFVCGTPEYMSPEQARGASLDHRSDLYAVGVILYQLTTGLLPFDSDSAVGFATMHLTEEPPPPSHRRPDARISPGMERLILKALSKDPNDRPQTAEAFRAELNAVDKERRINSGGPQRRGVSSPVLQPMPWKVTPMDQVETSVGRDRDPPWGPAEVSSEATVRAFPEALLDKPVLPRPEVALRPETTETSVRLRDASSLLAFKAVTVTLVTIAIGLAGYYLYQVSGARREGLEETSASAGGSDQDKPLYEQEIPPELRDEQVAARLAQEGDQAHQRGELERAASKYEEAFRKDPTPELSLKLGEVYYHRGHAREAKAWWQRHLRDDAQSKAKHYIIEAFGELAQ